MAGGGEPMVKFWRRKAQQDTRNTQPAAQPAAVPADLAAWAREADVSRLSSQTVREAEDYLNKYRHMNLELSQQMGWRVIAAVEAQVTPSPPAFAQPLDVIATVLALRRKQLGTGLSSPSALVLPSLGYEPYDTRLRRLGQSLAGVVTSADRTNLISLRRLRLPRLVLSRRVRFTNRFTEQPIDLRFSPPPRPQTWVQSLGRDGVSKLPKGPCTCRG